jgi:hypothetical protein
VITGIIVVESASASTWWAGADAAEHAAARRELTSPKLRVVLMPRPPLACAFAPSLAGGFWLLAESQRDSGSDGVECLALFAGGLGEDRDGAGCRRSAARCGRGFPDERVVRGSLFRHPNRGARGSRLIVGGTWDAGMSSYSREGGRTPYPRPSAHEQGMNCTDHVSCRLLSKPPNPMASQRIWLTRWVSRDGGRPFLSGRSGRSSLTMCARACRSRPLTVAASPAGDVERLACGVRVARWHDRSSGEDRLPLRIPSLGCPWAWFRECRRGEVPCRWQGQRTGTRANRRYSSCRPRR